MNLIISCNQKKKILSEGKLTAFVRLLQNSVSLKLPATSCSKESRLARPERPLS